MIKGQCAKCGRMILVAQNTASPNQMFISARYCSKCVNVLEDER